ncbi:hypothetical protein [Microbacterium sp. SORGH_AS_0888]|uniref:hypothetical protein n=1 Tax=Microbacterium sp. SORGH_AS_0888 TaxID=3041791 RepID=UPI00278788EA|nr:hypothetical protein [Microbacterium sp. SORGH_AS_0888]MDQ1129549.1 hypothetical protein [Microbacterium sp. SORGH_AS_0888]
MNSYIWNEDSESLSIYSAESFEYWEPLITKHFPDERVHLVPAKTSQEEIEKLTSIVVATGGKLSDGTQVVTVVPENDGAYVTIGVQQSDGMVLPSSEALRKALGTPVPLIVEAASDVASAQRNISPISTIWVGGAVDSSGITDGYYTKCSTAFRIGNLTDSTVGMLSADHCGSGKPTNSWYFSTNQTSTSSLGTYQGSLASVWPVSDTALWTGGNVSKLYPILLTGDHNDPNTSQLVRGGNYPAVGTEVCYSGSQSGNVCSNDVLYQNVTVCYPGSNCYSSLTWTSQQSDVPAAGNGDSGGPVYQMVNGLLKASGVISGIINGTSTCTGEPGSSGGRQCSSVALFAPIAAALGGSSSWGLSYYP